MIAPNKKPRKFAELRGKVYRAYTHQSDFAQAMGMDPTAMSRRMTGCTDWSRGEIVRACQLLQIPLTEAHLYFF